MKKLLLLLSVSLASQSYAQNIPAYVPTNGLVGWWPFSGNAIDSSGNGNNFTVNGPILSADRFGNANRAFKYSGITHTAQYLILNQITSFKTPNFSFSLWFNTESYYPNIMPSTPYDYANFNMQAIISMNSNNWSIGPAISTFLGLGDNTKIQTDAWVPSITWQSATSTSIISLNTWYNLIVTYNGSLLSLYLNGNLIYQINPMIVNYNNQYDLLLGGQRNGTNMTPMGGFKGKIDDFAWWNRALTPCEVQALYTGVPSTFNTNLIAQDTIKSCGDSVLVSATSGLNSYSWNTGATTASIFAKNTGWYKVTGANAQGCAATDSVFVSILKANILNNDTTVCLGASLTLNAQQATIGTSCTKSGLATNLQNGLVGYWPFCGNANDMSGNGNNGTVIGASLTSDRFGNANSAYGFTGSTIIPSYIKGDCSSFPTTNRTVSVWFYANDIGIGTAGREIMGYGGQTCGQSWFECVDNLDNAQNSYEVSGHCQNQRVLYYYGPNHPNSTWVNWIISTDNISGTKFYINGVNVKSDPTFINQTYVTGKNFIFGANVSPNGLNYYWDSNSNPFNGKLDDIAIWNRALSASEVAQLYQASSYATTYLWSTGATTPSINVTPTQTTKYWLQVSNGISTCTDTVTITVQNPTAPAVSNVSYCQGATASALTATASAGNTLLWYSTASGGSASSTAPMPSTTTAGSITYYVSQITPQGCESARATLTVTVNALPQVSITASKTPIICTGDSVVFIVSPQVAGQSYVWYKDGIIINGASNTSYAAKQSGAYSVKVTNSNGCSMTSATSTLNVYPWPTVNAGPDKEVPAGTSVDIITQTTNAQSIAWSPITGLSCTTCASPTATVNLPIVYIVTVTSAGGCSVSDTVAIQLVCEDDLLYMPNTFTPNGDGENDRFYPMGKGLGEVTVFRIVNRLGQVVYTRSRFAINNASYGWDGTFNGADLGMDVYSYYIEVPCATGQIIKKTGDISLLR